MRCASRHEQRTQIAFPLIDAIVFLNFIMASCPLSGTTPASRVSSLSVGWSLTAIPGINEVVN